MHLMMTIQKSTWMGFHQKYNPQKFPERNYNTAEKDSRTTMTHWISQKFKTITKYPRSE